MNRFLVAAAFSFLVCLAANGALAQSVEEADIDTRPRIVNRRSDVKQVARGIIELTNQYRQQRSLPTVTQNPALLAATAEHAFEMAKVGQLSHTVGGRTPAERALAHGYDSCIVLENIGYAFDPAGYPTTDLQEYLFQGWVESKPHRLNLEDPDVTDIGVGVWHHEESGGYYASLMMGRPKSAAIEFSVTNLSDRPIRYVTGAGKEFALDQRERRFHRRCRAAVLSFPDFREADSIQVDDGVDYSLVLGPQNSLRVERRGLSWDGES